MQKFDLHNESRGSKYLKSGFVIDLLSQNNPKKCTKCPYVSLKQ